MPRLKNKETVNKTQINANKKNLNATSKTIALA